MANKRSFISKVLTLEILPEYYDYLNLLSVFNKSNKVLFAQGDCILVDTGKDQNRIYISHIERFSLEIDSTLYWCFSLEAELMIFLHQRSVLTAAAYQPSDFDQKTGYLKVIYHLDFKSKKSEDKIDLIQQGQVYYDLLRKTILSLKELLIQYGDFSSIPESELPTFLPNIELSVPSKDGFTKQIRKSLTF